MSARTERGGASTALERRGLIALAIILVVAVTAIAAWRGSVHPPTSDTLSAPELIAEVDSAARADSLASVAGKKQQTKAPSRSSGRKGGKKAPKETSVSRRSPLDERPDLNP